MRLGGLGGKLFTDDITLVADSSEKLQNLESEFGRVYEKTSKCK